MLYFQYFLTHLKSQMQYKTSFLLTAAGQFVTSFSTFLMTYFLMRRFHTVDGFAMEEVLISYAAVLMAFSIAECFFRGFDRFSGMLANGEFDRILLRPRGVILQVLCAKIEFSRMGRFLQALITFVVILPRCGIEWTPGRAAVLLFMIAGGTALFAGLFTVGAALCFFTTEGLEVINIFTDGGKEFGVYPLSVYGPVILRFYTFVVPLAMCQYYPLLWLTGRSANPWFAAAPICGFFFWIPAYLLWRVGVRHYVSTGS